MDSFRENPQSQAVKYGDEIWGQTGRTPIFLHHCCSEKLVNVLSVPEFSRILWRRLFRRDLPVCFFGSHFG